jgi:hypothetical protein
MDETNTQQVTNVADGNEAGLWRTEIPESLRGNDAFAPYATKNDLWNGHIEAVNKLKDLEGRLSAAVIKPADGATNSEMDAYYKALGRPDNPDGYDLPKAAGTEGMIDTGLEKAFKGWAYESGLTNAQAKSIYDKYMAASVLSLKAAEEKRGREVSAAEGALRKEWGNEYEANVTSALRAVETFGGDALKAYMNETGLGNDPRMIRAFLKIGKAISEDSIGHGSAGGDSIKRGSYGQTVFNYPTMNGT